MPEPASPTSPKRLEEVINWTLPGLTMYYRDSKLGADVIKLYQPGKIFRSATFVDVSSFAGRPAVNCRFIFASSKAAPLYQVNPATQKWGLHCINCNSYFKVLDVYEKAGVTQVFLLHIPYQGIDVFQRTVLKLQGENIEEQIIAKARASLDQKLSAEVPAALNEAEWLHRTSFPIGLNPQNAFFPLEPTEPLLPAAVPMYTAIKKMTKDLTDLNEAPLPEKPVQPKPDAAGKAPEKKGGFWPKWLGGKGRK